jgi:glycosyltransferase involved in cell wall biosynthesis
MKVIIETGKEREFYVNGMVFPTNTEIDISFDEALRLSKLVRLVFKDTENGAYIPSIYTGMKEVAFMADIDTNSGWGNVGLNLIKYSEPYVKSALIGRTYNVEDKEIREAAKREIRQGMGVIIHEQPKEEWNSLLFDRKICIVPFETTKAPASWIPRINNCKALIVPCKQNIQMYRDSGVTIPIELVHWGTDIEKFHLIDRPDHPVFTFGHMGSLSERKGTDLLVTAFLKAFPTEKDVQLICKTSRNNFIWASRDPRVIVDMTPVPHDELMRCFFSKIDCFVYPTRGEGWGLGITEAMSTGVPAIVTGWSGPMEFMTSDVGWLIDYTMTPSKNFSEKIYHEDCGDWANPSEEHLIQLMRYAYEHQDETKKKGQAAAKHIRDHFTWEKTIKMYTAALDKHLS